VSLKSSGELGGTNEKLCGQCTSDSPHDASLTGNARPWACHRAALPLFSFFLSIQFNLNPFASRNCQRGFSRCSIIFRLVSSLVQHIVCRFMYCSLCCLSFSSRKFSSRMTDHCRFIQILTLLAAPIPAAFIRRCQSYIRVVLTLRWRGGPVIAQLTEGH